METAQMPAFTPEAAVEQFGDTVFRAAFGLVKNPQDAEDVVQETFLQYWSQKREFETEQHVRAWLLRVAINKAKNKTRTFFRRNVLPLEDYMERLTFESEESAGLFEAVMGLDEKYRIVLHLFYYEDYSVQEIANILHITPGNVKTRLSRGRASLRSTLKEAWDNDES